MNKILADIVRRAGKWPKDRQEELLDVATAIEEQLKGGVYHATTEELKSIDRGLTAAYEGKMAKKKEVDAVFATFRKA